MPGTSNGPARIPSPSADPDLFLIRAMAQGDKAALDELYQRHGRAILAYLSGQLNNQHIAEEVLQDVMLAAWRGAAGFRGESRVKTWLLAIARLKSLNVIRRRKPDGAMLHENIAAEDTGLQKQVEVQAERERVRKALVQLPDNQRETLELIFFHDMTGPEAAKLLGISPGTVKSRVHRAKNTLRGLLLRREAE